MTEKDTCEPMEIAFPEGRLRSLLCKNFERKFKLGHGGIEYADPVNQSYIEVRAILDANFIDDKGENASGRYLFETSRYV